MERGGSDAERRVSSSSRYQYYRALPPECHPQNFHLINQPKPGQCLAGKAKAKEEEKRKCLVPGSARAAELSPPDVLSYVNMQPSIWALLALAVFPGTTVAFAPALTGTGLAQSRSAPFSGACVPRRWPLPVAHKSRIATVAANVKMLDGTEAAASAFVLFNVAYVGQLLLKPRYDPY